MSGALFRIDPDKRKSENAPEFDGSITIRGEKLFLAGWVRSRRAGRNIEPFGETCRGEASGSYQWPARQRRQGFRQVGRLSNSLLMSTMLDLPLPPSVNRLWRSNRGRVHRAPRYLSWLKAAGWELVLQKPAPYRHRSASRSPQVAPIAGVVTRTTSRKPCWISSPSTRSSRTIAASCRSPAAGTTTSPAAACTSKCGVAGLRRNARVRVRLGSDIVRSSCRKP